MKEFGRLMKNKANTLDSRNDAASYELRIASLEKKVNWIYTIGITVVSVLGFLGIGACYVLSVKFEQLNKESDAIAQRQSELNQQIIHTGQQNIVINTQLSGLSIQIAKKYDELLQRFSELQKLARHAQYISEQAITNAGLLADSVKASNLSADRAQKLADQAQNTANKIQVAYVDIQKNLQLLDSFLSQKIPSLPTKFQVEISGNYGIYYITSGSALPYDRKFSGSSSVAHIVVSSKCAAVINDSGSSNTFVISNEVRDQIIFEGTGRYRQVKFLKQ